MSCIQTAIPLLPLCACLACNGAVFTFIDIQIPYKHNNNQTRASKSICSGPRLLIWHRYIQWPQTADLTQICATFYSNSIKLSKSLTKYLFISQLHSPLSISAVPVTTSQLSRSGLLENPSPQLVPYPFPYPKLISIPQHLLYVGMSAAL